MINLFVKKAYALEIKNPFATGPLSGTDPQTGLNNVVNSLISIVFAAAGLLFLAMLFAGGIAWITAGGDPKAVAAARSRLTNALIGLVIVVAAFAIAQIILKVLGLGNFVDIKQG
jgi:hypothetical protein